MTLLFYERAAQPGFYERSRDVYMVQLGDICHLCLEYKIINTICINLIIVIYGYNNI